MEFRDTLNRINGLVERVTGKLAFIAPLATRIVIGLAFFQAGTGKFRHFENVVGFFQGLGIPFPTFHAGLVASMETVGGIMLILGLFTRFFASGLSITMVVALLTACGNIPDRRHRFRLSPVPSVARLLRRRQAQPRRPAAQNPTFGAGGRRLFAPRLFLSFSARL